MYKILSITPIDHIKGVKSGLRKIGSLICLNNPTKNEILNLKDDIDVLFTNPNKSKFYIDKIIIDHFKQLKAICTASTGTNHIDKEYAKVKNIKIISITKEMSVIEKISSTAEHAFSLMLSSLRNIPKSFDDVKRGNWDYEPFVGRQLDHLTIGIVGYGRLGKKFAKYANSFNSKILAYDPYKKVSENYVHQTELDVLVKNSDIISLHVHVTKETTNMINKSLFNKMKRNIILINTSRGEIIDQNDLIFFLSSNNESKYATDVLSNEQEKITNNPIIELSKKTDQIIITPHIAGMTVEGQEIAYNHAVKMLKKFLLNKGKFND